MKKYMIFCLAAALFASCAKDADVFEPGIEDANAVRFAGSSEDTRVSYEDTGSAFKISWDKEDQIGIFARTADRELSSNIAYKAAESGATSEFSPVSYSERIRWADDTSKHTFYACSPYDEAAGTDPAAVAVSIPAVQHQSANNDSGHLPALDFMYAHTGDLVKSEDPISMNFKHAFSVLDLHLPKKENVRIWLTNVEFTCISNTNEKVSFENGRIDLSTGELDLSGATCTNSICLECDFATSDLEDQHLFLMVTPGHAGETFEITTTINGSKYVLAQRTVPQEGLPAGRILTVDAVLPEFDESDLYLPENLSADGTANCYVVNRAGGYYKFRADVKGNGIPRSLAYTTESASRAGEFSYTEADLKIEPKAAVVLWYNCVQYDRSNWLRDCPILMHTFVLKSDGCIYFETPLEFVNGNAVIAVIDQPLAPDEIEVDPATRRFTNANILWSWNLIFSENYDLNSAEQTVTKGGYTFMTRDLGAVLDADYELGGYTKSSTMGNVYQWGSKNPLPHIPDYASADVAYMTGLWFTPTFTTVPGLEIEGEIGSYGKVGNQVFGNSKAHLLTYIGDEVGDMNYSNDIAVKYSTELPYRWFNRSETGDDQTQKWIRDFANGAAFWGNPDGEMELKTIYDPCPTGWKVPSEKAWKALTDDMTVEVTARNSYFDFSGIYFPGWEGRDSACAPGGYSIGGGTGYIVRARYMTSNASEYYGLMGRYFRISAKSGNYDKYPEAQCDEIISGYTTLGSRIRCVKDNE